MVAVTAWINSFLVSKWLSLMPQSFSERESGQKVEDEVIERIFYEFRGQPGLTCWFGELLDEGWEQFVPSKDRPMGHTDRGRGAILA